MNSEKSFNQFYKDLLKKNKEDIDPLAIEILQRLKMAHFEGYIVGGAVRDLLVGLKPKDFDIATNATPQEIRRKVPNCFVIGRRFKLVHANRRGKVFEIATYRREGTPEELNDQEEEDFPFIGENFFGSILEDSFRRDFTVNALYYDPISEELVDHCEGLQDIHQRVLKMIGDPEKRIKEDPIRILRGIRLAHKLEFRLDPYLRAAIQSQVSSLSTTVLPRRREEWLKLFKIQRFETVLIEMNDLQIFKNILPSWAELFTDEIKTQEFFYYFSRSFELGGDMKSPTELFICVAFSFLLAQYGTYENQLYLEILTRPRVQIFLKEGLGMFKTEISALQEATSFIFQLTKKESFIKKGPLRKISFLMNSSFEMSLKLGFLCHFLTARDVLFWQNQKQDLNKPPQGS